jgi:hypothetical protein
MKEKITSLDELRVLRGEKSIDPLILQDSKKVLLRRVLPASVVAAILWTAWHLSGGGIPQAWIFMCITVGGICLSTINFLQKNKAPYILGLSIGSLSGAAIAVSRSPDALAMMWIIVCFGVASIFLVMWVLHLEMLTSKRSIGEVLSSYLSYSSFWSSMVNSCILVFGLIYGFGYYFTHPEINITFSSLPGCGLTSAGMNVLCNICYERQKSLEKQRKAYPKTMSLLRAGREV